MSHASLRLHLRFPLPSSIVAHSPLYSTVILFRIRCTRSRYRHVNLSASTRLVAIIHLSLLFVPAEISPNIEIDRVVQFIKMIFYPPSFNTDK